MDNRKWLKRKYPKTYKDVSSFFNDEQLRIFKHYKYKLGELTETINQEEIYRKGELCMFKRTNPINDYNYPLHPIIVKCSDRLTSSGYNSFWVHPNQVKELNN